MELFCFVMTMRCGFMFWNDIPVSSGTSKETWRRMTIG